MTHCNKHPDCTTFVYQQVGPHVGMYCGECGKWIRWLQKSEKVLQVMPNVDVVMHKSEPRPIKVVFDEDDDLPW